ncbi:MAG: hypothetical protein QOD12_2320 [Verrucomicrobiota bacterium]|jgi:hypothetical protein
MIRVPGANARVFLSPKCDKAFFRIDDISKRGEWLPVARSKTRVIGPLIFLLTRLDP